MGGAGAAGNDDMLKGAEGQATCTALAQALAACPSLHTLDLTGEWGKGRVGEQTGGDEGCSCLERGAPVSACLPPHLHRTCVCGTARV